MSKEIQHCPTCGRITSERVISLTKVQVVALYKVWEWCRSVGKNTFERKEVAKLWKNMDSETPTGRFGDIVMFGDLMTRVEQGVYSLNLPACEAFFAGRHPIPIQVIKNPVTRQIRQLPPEFISSVPSVSEFLDEKGRFVPEYL